ncbi:MAG: hypothetical protein ACPGGK_02450 [Pikeienuella sp.]
MSSRLPVTLSEKVTYLFRRGVAEVRGAVRLQSVINDDDLAITVAPGRGDEALAKFNRVPAKMAGESTAIDKFRLSATGDDLTGFSRIYAIHGQSNRWHAAHFAQATGVLA